MVVSICHKRKAFSPAAMECSHVLITVTKHSSGSHQSKTVKIPNYRSLCLPSRKKKMTVVLDLDETLVHSEAEPPKNYDFVINPNIDEEYASMILDCIDPKRVIKNRYYRQDCRDLGGIRVKDLSSLGRDLSRVLIIDDNPISFFLQPENGIQIHPFKGDLQDRELWKIVEFLKACQGFEDVRRAIGLFKS